jgi:hypothetical protein
MDDWGRRKRANPTRRTRSAQMALSPDGCSRSPSSANEARDGRERDFSLEAAAQLVHEEDGEDVLALRVLAGIPQGLPALTKTLRSPVSELYAKPVQGQNMWPRRAARGEMWWELSASFLSSLAAGGGGDVSSATAAWG